MMLERYSQNPILLPIGDSSWESINVFNPSVLYHNGLYHMHYRAQGHDYVSRIGYAVGADGVTFNRMREPVFEPSGEHDSRGVEDPRVTELEGTFYMTYTAYGRYGSITPMIARSTNLVTWETIGPIVTGEDNKDHVLFPERIGGRYAAFHRRKPDVWIAYSDDLETWAESDMAVCYGPTTGDGWDSVSVGSNGVPIATEDGWLCIYHGYDESKTYRLGVILLDRGDPTQVLGRAAEPILEPAEIYEIRGDVPNVVFSNANPVVDGRVNVYYGGADHVTCLATCGLTELLGLAQRE